VVYAQFGHATPYLSGALIIVLAIGSVVLVAPPSSPQAEAEANA
jgi:hypothetical protein